MFSNVSVKLSILLTQKVTEDKQIFVFYRRAASSPTKAFPHAVHKVLHVSEPSWGGGWPQLEGFHRASVRVPDLDNLGFVMHLLLSARAAPMLSSCIFEIDEWRCDRFPWRVLQSRWTSSFFPTVLLAGRTPADRRKLISYSETGELETQEKKKKYLNVVFQDFDVGLLENLAELLMQKHSSKDPLTGFWHLQDQVTANPHTEGQQGQIYLH